MRSFLTKVLTDEHILSVILSVSILEAENARNRVTGVGKDANVKKWMAMKSYYIITYSAEWCLLAQNLGYQTKKKIYLNKLP